MPSFAPRSAAWPASVLMKWRRRLRSVSSSPAVAARAASKTKRPAASPSDARGAKKPGQHERDSTSLQRECAARARYENNIHASRSFREMIARPKISRNEWTLAEIGAFEVGHSRAALEEARVDDGGEGRRGEEVGPRGLEGHGLGRVLAVLHVEAARGRVAVVIDDARVRGPGRDAELCNTIARGVCSHDADSVFHALKRTHRAHRSVQTSAETTRSRCLPDGAVPPVVSGAAADRRNLASSPRDRSASKGCAAA